ncbi:hypothetical protein GH5_03028 [Leishmania sp. Ghana 2012 LV757]|uniref:hypothetical protein n=1 Tax=Leishmania sp. Ghana 2012 LV757 TaxID=2803181 RepID=UPI001B505301|nr:hypothetical protein GH5_03028 [Leishmania sp. Ghana 2012 LV757]
MGCKESSMKEREDVKVGPKDSRPSSGNVNAGADEASKRIGSSNGSVGGDNGEANKVTERAERTPKATGAGYSSEKDLHNTDAPCVPDSLITFVPVTSPAETQPQPQAAGVDLSRSVSSTNEELNGSFSVDLSGSFRISYSNKGDMLPSKRIPERRRSRFISPKQLETVSPHPSDNDIVLICTDCGMDITENCESVLCALTGKAHI